MAGALEVVGERWGLLIVRDLLPGERRFSDLLRSCGGITPRQLAARLRQLESAGVVERERHAGRREVRYRLTPVGRELEPAVDALLAWGVRHTARAPTDDEPVQAYHVLNGTRLALEALDPLRARVTSWTWRFPGEPHTLRFDGAVWTLSAGEDPAADVVVDTTPRDWAKLVLAPRGGPRDRAALQLHGRPSSVREFSRLFGIPP
jgi:DNA-binding HxlR family transcriptional regulator